MSDQQASSNRVRRILFAPRFSFVELVVAAWVAIVLDRWLHW